jgi:hypothetical protein
MQIASTSTVGLALRAAVVVVSAVSDVPFTADEVRGAAMCAYRVALLSAVLLSLNVRCRRSRRAARAPSLF